jgi:hypothetical protein
MSRLIQKQAQPGSSATSRGPASAPKLHAPRPPWAPAQRRDGPASLRPNRSGLPDGLKTGVEALSGIPMDDVRVHRNSQEPAKLGALAFAKGSEVHLAPGQDEHLPHEAWHVVQQKQGRVAATGVAGGQAVNDDAALEREADRMGAAAVRGSPSPAAQPAVSPGRGGSGPVQRRKQVFCDGKSLGGDVQKAVSDIADSLDGHVAKAAQIILADPTLGGKQSDGYLGAWAKTYGQLITNKSVPEFFYARYGYAVETIASLLMPKKVGAYAVQTQYATGATRPDFVVFNANAQDIAWLDITSSASAGHIRAKQHSGWSKRPYVAEILYDPPKISDFAAGTGLSEEQKKALAAIENKAAEDELDFQAGHDAIGALLENALAAAHAQGKGGLSKTGTAAVVTFTLKSIYPKITVSQAGEVLNNITSITIGDKTDSGKSWGNWAFKVQAYKAGRAFIMHYGGLKRRPPSSCSASTSSATSSSTTSSNSSTTSSSTEDVDMPPAKDSQDMKSNVQSSNK